MKTGNVTIKHLAELVGFSYSTVSRALNNHPRVNPLTRAKILEVAREKGYQPNFQAKTLVKKKSNLIGLLVYDFRNTFYAELARTIQDRAQELGYWVIQANTDDNPERSKSLVNFMQNMGVDGIILASACLHDGVAEELIDRGFPMVMANRWLMKPVGDYVILDNQYGAYLAVMHFIHLGCRRIAVIKGSEYASTGVERFEGYLKAIRESGLPVDEGLIKAGNYTEASGYQCARELMNQTNRPDAIFCGDDEIALGAMGALAESGLSVPEDVAVVGFDNSSISSHSRIQLTTVSQDVRKMGMLATDMIFRRIKEKGKEYEHAILQPTLIIRESCGFYRRHTSPRKA